MARLNPCLFEFVLMRARSRFFAALRMTIRKTKTKTKATAKANTGVSPLRRKSAPSVEMTAFWVMR
jgi:hypothetical protein